MEVRQGSYGDLAWNLREFRRTGDKWALDDWARGWEDALRAEASGLRPQLCNWEWEDVFQEWKLLLLQWQGVIPADTITAGTMEELLRATKRLLIQKMRRERRPGTDRRAAVSEEKRAPRELPPPSWAAEERDDRSRGYQEASVLLHAVMELAEGPREPALIHYLVQGDTREQIALRMGTYPMQVQRWVKELRRRMGPELFDEWEWRVIARGG